MIALAKDRFGAPVAVIRTSAAGNDVQGKVTMCAYPSIAITLDIYEAPIRQWELIEIVCHLSGRRVAQDSCFRTPKGEPMDLFRRPTGNAQKRVRDFQQRGFNLSDQNEIDSISQILLDVIG